MIIIVEGVDRVGKSTLCKKLEESLGYFIFKDKSGLLPRTEQALKDKYADLFEVIEKHKNIIIDRFHLTELVYNSYRGDDFPSYLDVDRKLADKSCALLFVESEDIKESSRQHGSDLFGHELMFKALFLGSNISFKRKIKYKDFDKCVNALAILKEAGL